MDPVATAGGSVDSPRSGRVVDPTIVAHRGFAGVYPENTHAAMWQATTGDVSGGGDPGTEAKSGVEAVEIDVIRCATGELVVFHDAYLGRVTDVPPSEADRTVWETPLSELRELEVLDTGETIPLLSELLETIPTDVTVFVELKNPGTAPGRSYRELSDAQRRGYDRAWGDVAERLAGILGTFDNEFRVISSFEGALRAMREGAPEVPLGYFFWESIETGLEITRRYDCELLCPPRTAIPGTSFFNDTYGSLPAGGFRTRDLVSIAHEEGRTVHAWTIETWRQATELRAAGVDGLLCEYPGLLETADGLADRSVLGAVGPVDD